MLIMQRAKQNEHSFIKDMIKINEGLFGNRQ